MFDLDGECSTKKKCAARVRAAKKKTEHRLRLIKRTMREGREARAAHDVTYRGTYGGIEITLPWEHKINAIVGGIQNELNDLLGHSCAEKAETFGFIGAAGEFGKRYLTKKGAGNAAKKAAGLLSDIADGSEFLGAGFFVASRLGVC